MEPASRRPCGPRTSYPLRSVQSTLHPTADPARLYTDRIRSYERFVRLGGYPFGLRAFFERYPGLRSDLRILDAGCGTGMLTLALRDALQKRGLHPRSIHGFDLTPAMLDRFREKIENHRIAGIELAQANVLDLEALPDDWRGYDLIVTASMMEYLPRDRLTDALSGLRDRLAPGGRLLLFITRDNLLMRPLIGRWWQSNVYSAPDLIGSFRSAGFGEVGLERFPWVARHLDLWGHIVEAWD
jgi:ubiquinone/menaquinone biosynthesis C-methylase UbiE